MKKIVVLSASLAAFGLLFAPAAQAEDTMMKKETHAHVEAHASYEERYNAQRQYDEG